MAILGKLFGDANQKAVKDLQPLIEQINSKESGLQRWTLPMFVTRMTEIRTAVGGDTTKLDDYLVEVFAMVREISRRTIQLRHFDVQLIGGIVLHRGQIAEMKTGEGKTLVATAAIALNALAGRGAHVVTVNDYLARRDAGWMSRIYHALGLSVGIIVHEQAFLYDPSSEAPDALEDRTKHLRPVARREAYAADITYGTNNEFGFDYLRDNMVPDVQYLVQRPFAFAIIDEVDSILIDEARTPLIISAPAEESSERYRTFAHVVEQLEAMTDYSVDEKMRTAVLTDAGISKIEKILNVENIYQAGGIETVHHLEQALKAKTLFTRDKDYVVREGEVIIVDEFTGRLMIGRRYSEGLHQAIEAKEGLDVKQENQTMATVTLQNLFRMYPKLAGMTGTAATEAEEFHKIYNLDVTVVPTNRPMVRTDLPDVVFKNEKGKFMSVIREIRRRHEAGQPVLVGTISIERNELLSELLTREGIEHEILNAKNHEKEAQIIAQAGRRGAVTLATNIAGRGVDILLGGAAADAATATTVKELGGLHIIGTERHESRRIDNQLRGRAGRQGDPGSSQFYVSMEDDLMRIFGSDRMKGLMDRMGVPDDMPLESKLVSRSLEQAQKKVEGHNFDTRKHLVEYDDVINKHREVIYKRRKETLNADRPGVLTRLKEILNEEIGQIVSFHTSSEQESTWDLDAMYTAIDTLCQAPIATRLKLEDFRDQAGDPNHDAKARTLISNYLAKHVESQLETLAKQFPQPEQFPEVVRNVILRSIDQLWVEHLDMMERLREGISLRGYGQRDPLVEYKKEAFDLFSQLVNSINVLIANTVFKVTVAPADVVAPPAQRKSLITSGPQKEAVAARSTQGPVTPAKLVVGGVDLSKVGRNDPCPCGSGKKFKKCYLAQDPGCRLLHGAGPV